jgi:hypothetical protein
VLLCSDGDRLDEDGRRVLCETEQAFVALTLPTASLARVLSLGTVRAGCTGTHGR